MEDINNTYIFEYPFNEHMRTCMRLENLFNYTYENLNSASTTNSRSAITGLLQILDILDRQDLKSKLAQMMSQQVSTLAQLEQFPQVDTERLKQTLTQMDELIGSLHQNRNRMTETLRTNEFLEHLRLQLSNPGGICLYKSPALVLWLNRPAEERKQDLEKWLGELNDIKESIRWLLKLTRESSNPQPVESVSGFFTRSLDPAFTCQMARIKFPAKINLYPEVMVSKYRLTIRILQTNFQNNGRPFQYTQPLNFELTLCKL